MCGIYVTVGRPNADIRGPATKAFVPGWLTRRGPDQYGCVTMTVGDQDATLHASVLQMRQSVVTQPVWLLKGKAVMAWNGEVYQMMDTDGETVKDVYDSPSDTDVVARMVEDAISMSQDINGQSIDNDDRIQSTAQSIASALSRLVNAEFAIAIVTEEAIYYARDDRRSLVMCDASATAISSHNEKPDWSWQLASAASDSTQTWTEVHPGYVFAFCLTTYITHAVPLETASIHDCNTEIPNDMIHASLHAQELLLQAVRRRCQATGTAILFSGGLDSTLVAALALQCVDSVTLMTVSFVNNDCDTSQAADAILAHQSAAELRTIYPTKTIHLVHKIVEWSEIVEHEPRVRALILPKHTVMDLNIATALWFAAGGGESISRRRTDESAVSRVLLSGLGADELAGGYGRHRKAYERGGDAELRQELDLDIERLWDRNLGRDDRILSDTSQEVRFPFLDLNFACFLKQLPVSCLVDYSSPIGDKRILRLMAERLALPNAAGAAKRAIQFGSRMAHVSDKRRFGSRRKASGQALSSPVFT